MSDELKRFQGLVHHGADHAAPYPVSRMAPAIELVDLARQISEADAFLGVSANARLNLIADQIRALQAEARAVLERTRRDQELHRVPCTFRRRPGQVCHLYRRPDGSRYFSLLSPADWGDRPAQVHEGSYRLEPDMSWTDLKE